MTDYQIVDDAWSETTGASATTFGGNRPSSNLPVALDLERAYVFRDSDGRIVHKYPLASAEGIYYLRHHVSTLASPPPLYELGSSKSAFLTAVWLVVRRLAAVRRTATVLEIGSTIGENYDLLNGEIARHRLPITLEFVGIEISESLSAFARMSHRGDPRFHAITADGAGLDRFPDRSFDIVICNGVANFVSDPEACFAGMARVCRLAMVLALEVAEPDSIWRISAQEHKPTFAPSRARLDALWRPAGPFHDYLISRGPFSGLKSDAGGTGYFLGGQADVDQIFFERHIVARHKLFPAADAVRRMLA